MEERNKGLIVFGIVLLVIGSVAAFYQQTPRYGEVITPYQGVGIILVVAGIVFVGLGLLYQSHRTAPPPPPTNP